MTDEPQWSSLVGFVKKGVVSDHVAPVLDPVFADPGAFSADDNVPGWVERVPGRAVAAVAPLAPTYVWAAFKGVAAPAGPPLRVPPRHIG